jgi:dephospho-CoA kinase
MPAIGITGGIATGKTTFCKLLVDLLPTAKFFDADKAARALTDEDSDVQREIREVFGSDLYSGGGDLNRGRLRAMILESAAKRIALEQILHPRIRSQWSVEAKRYRNSSDFFFADIPLLYETGGESLCDRVVVVACSPEVQLQRLRERRSPTDAGRLAGARPSISKGQAEQMMKAQMSIAEKIKRADHVVWNNNGEAVLTEQARDLVRLWRAAYGNRA